MALQYRDKVTGKIKYVDESNDPLIKLEEAKIEIEMLKLEQAQSNAEMIDLMMSMLGGI